MNIVKTKHTDSKGNSIYTGLIRVNKRWSGIVIIFGDLVEIYMTVKARAKIFDTFKAYKSFDSEEKAINFASRMNSDYRRLIDLYKLGFRRF